MFVLKNAWRSVVRNAGRNILIVIIVAVIAAAATIGLAIRNAAQTARETGLSSTTVTATIDVDRDQMMNGAGQSSSSDGNPDKDAMRKALDQDSLTLTDYKKYAKASSVPVTTYYTETTSVNGTDSFQPVETSTSNSERSSSDSTDTNADSGSSNSSNSSNSNDSNDGGNAPDGQNGQNGQNGQGDQGGHGGFGGMTSGDFSLVGFSSDTAVSNASNGTFTMASGKVFGYGSDSDGQVIISQALAKFNGLKVGSTITVEDLSGSDTTYTLTVVGIYKNDTSADIGSHGPMGGTSSDPDNAIYTSVGTLKKLGLSTESDSDSSASTSSTSSDSSTQSTQSTQTSASRTQLSFSYVLGSKDDYETFASDVKKAGLDSNHKVSSADVENYESSLVPLDNLAKFALTLLIIVLAVGAAVLIVINLFNIRERKYEIGVLTAIGITKAKVVAQFVTELLIVTMAGIAIGVAGGAAASVPVSNQLLAQQVSSQESQASSRQAQFGRDADMPGAPGQGGQSGDSQSGQSDGNSQSDSGSQSNDGQSNQSNQPNQSNQQQSAPSGQNAPSGKGDARGFGKAVEYVSTINATVNFKIIGELVLIGIALTLVSALVGVVAIVRYEPLQILADRS
ncbi:ABC transporter permease [Bifidobacterium sp. 64T4]|uniref:ABC transporter permease n=1 Tax=Bifidobacterium pongonis TaxID=2834432 RepID=UPI001C594E99|nr:ABC transporter permease [Bifidobacterium pongonis]MBW3094151.1 ABC transporter permease [Bifidobacterium pongonis]